MKKSIAVASALLSSVITTQLEAKEERVSFDSHGAEIVGSLYLPEGSSAEGKVPAVIITGAWTTVKEQMPATYAKAMVDRGFAALTFDFRGWGESVDKIQYLEDPTRKIQDIIAAANFLASRAEVSGDRIYGLGICASAGYMIDAANQSDVIGRVSLIAPWLHDASIVDAVYGGNESVKNLIKVGEEASKSAEPVILEAASSTNKESLMFQAPYYTEPDRGAIPEYDNKFNVASWKGWLEYDAIQAASKLKNPILLIHSESAAIPQGVKAFAEKGGDKVSTLWLDDVTQFDFYDKSEPVKSAADAAAEHFQAPEKAMPDASRSEAAIKTIIEAVAVLADRGQFSALEDLYHDEVLVDYSSLNGMAAELKSNRQLMTEWANVLPGFDLTRHTISNVVVSIEGTEASAAASVVADHYVGDLFWQVSGEYEYQLFYDYEGWKITGHKFILQSEKGTRDVFGLASKNAAENPTDFIVRQKTQDAVMSFLTSLEKKDMDMFANVWTEDAIQEMPYAPDNFPKRVRGKANLIKHYAGWPENSGKADFTSYLLFHPMEDPQMVFAEFKGDVEVVSTGRQYIQHYGGLFHVEGGKIQLFREYFNPTPFVYAFGLDEDAASN